MKNLLSIYNTFKPNKIRKKEKESLNDIIKGTKSVLANRIRFNKYIHSYSKTTEKSTFKSPGISEYPIFRKQSYFLIPLRIKKINFFEDINEKNEKDNEDDLILKPKKLLYFSPKESESLYKKKLIFNIKTSKSLLKNKLYKLSLNKNVNNKKERYNSLFLDFFYKWSNNGDIYPNLNFSGQNINDNNNSYNNFENIKNEKYSELKYDDNIIFNQDYSKFINKKLEYIKDNKIENRQEKIESIFNDINGKEIKLKLESVKIIFKPINKKINGYNKKNDTENKNKEIILYIPLYFAFFICHKKLDLFKKVLMSAIVFSDDFEKIEFNDELIYPTLKDYIINNIYNSPSPKMNKNNEFRHESKKNLKNSNLTLPLKKSQPLRKLVTKNYNTSAGEKKSSIGSSFSMLRSSFIDKSLNNNTKKEAIFHSNRNRNTNNLCSINYSSRKNIIDNNDNENDLYTNNTSNNFNEYYFLWETTSKTFMVNIHMPKIYFKYKSLKNEIIAFCDKNLFLYLYKNNFINWDFYVLNFLFSIKAFRKIILNNYSIFKQKIFTDILLSQTINNTNGKLYNSLNNTLFSFRNKTRNNINEKDRYNTNTNTITNNISTINNKESKNFEIPIEPIIINKNENKIYNTLNENNESLLFFYTDNLYNNSIIKLYSYLIIIDYEKLNPKLKWKYYLDFKQMKQLNEISKYESLDSFLPKIIKTDFQNGYLSMDFSLFDEFDIDILGYEKKNIMNTTKKSAIFGSSTAVNTISPNKELCIDIKYPFVRVIKTKYNNKNNIFFNMNKIDLDINFLQNINNYNIDTWPKKILEIIHTNKDNLTNSLYLCPEYGSNNELSKNKNIFKSNPLNNSVSINNVGNSPRKFIKSITFNGIPVTSKFH